MYKILICVCLAVCFICVNCDDTEASFCEWDHVKGTCVEARRCLSTSELRNKDEHPVCGQKGDVNLICCTDCELVNDTSNAVINPVGGLFWKDGRKSRDHCLQYLKDVPNMCAQQGYYGSVSKLYNEEKKCHAISIWAIGGAPQPGAEHPRENPYEAIMGFGQDLDSAIWMTTGAIISEKFILTSATGHQTTTSKKLPLKFAALGVHNRSTDNKDWKIHTVKQIHHHPEWTMDTNYNDLALLELDTEITFNKDVLPACLPDPEATIDTKTVKFSSWKEPNIVALGQFTDVAEIVQAKQISAQDCEAKFKKASRAPGVYNVFLPQGINDTTLLCYEKKQEFGHTIGTPLFVTSYLSRCMNTVVGIHAFNDFRASVAAFTKVSHYVPWIESVVWPDEKQ